jgi:two-component system, OmpR family, sensor kinase
VPDVQDYERKLATLSRLMEIPLGTVQAALSLASDSIADALGADKVDAFLYDPTRDSLVAVGSSNQPLSSLQHQLGLNMLQISNGGRVVHVYKTGETFRTGRLDQDPVELVGVKAALGIRSKIGVPLDFAGERRGMMMIASKKPEFFSEHDARFAEIAAGWISSVAHRAELMENVGKNAAEQGRRAAAEELMTLFAHDLHNYLQPLLHRLWVIQSRAEKEDRRADHSDAERAIAVVNRIRSFSGDVLDLTRLDTGVLTLERKSVDIVALVNEAAAVLSTPDHLVEVKPAEDVRCNADPQRLRQCLDNLIANAIHHSPDNASVTVLVSRRRTDKGSGARIDVIDQGPGIPLELRPRLFERYVKGKDEKAGLGLGLFLARRIAKLHDGDLVLESPPGKGAHFTLTLPCEEI